MTNANWPPMQNPTMPTEPVHSGRDCTWSRAARMSSRARPRWLSNSRKTLVTQRARPPREYMLGVIATNPAAAMRADVASLSGPYPNASCTTTTPGHGPCPSGTLSSASIGPSRVSILTVVTPANLRNRSRYSGRSSYMAMRLFLLYVVIELAVIVALVSTIGFGWTVLLLLGTFMVGIALAGSQVKRHIRRLQSGLSAATVQGAAADSVLVALGTVLVVVPGLASSAVGALLLLPPTRAAARPLVTAMAARRMPLITGAGASGYTAPRGDYIDGEVVDVVDVEPAAVEPKPDADVRGMKPSE